MTTRAGQGGFSKKEKTDCNLHDTTFTHGCPECERRRRIHALIALSRDPDALDWEALKNIDRLAWGYEGDK